ncbi:MAG: hypothetical protein K9M13_02725, partial [Simkaniaceae bacterium]|nr:hypothetical protein [Simkaniaceae bacterium]
MDPSSEHGRLSREQLVKAMEEESANFQTFYLWLEAHMPPSFFENVEQSQLMLIAHNLKGFPLQAYHSQINFKDCIVVMCLDSFDADMKILKEFKLMGVKNYQSFISNVPPPFEGASEKLPIAFIHFTEYLPVDFDLDALLPEK